MAAENFGRNGVQFSDKQLSCIFFKIWLTRCLEMLAVVPPVFHGSFHRSACDLTVKKLYVVGAASENNEDTGENDEVRGSLYYISWSLREHRLQL